MPPTASNLDIEASVFTRYLAGANPSDYVRSRYRDGHGHIPYRLKGDEDALDVALVVVARRGPLRARLADAYARVFRPHGVLRQKLALLLAVLENSPGVHRRFTAGGRGLVPAILAIAANLLLFLAAFVAGVILFGPIHGLLRGRRPVPRAAP